MRRGLYTIEFEPVVQIGDYVKLLPESVFGGALYVVEKIIPYPVSAVIDLGSIASLSEMSDFYQITHISLPANWFGQWRLYLLDDFVVSEMRYKGRAGNAFWTLKERLGFMSKITSKSRDWFTEIFTFQDDKIYVKGKNIHDFDLPRARIMVVGYGFKISLTGETGKPYTRIPIGALEVA